MKKRDLSRTTYFFLPFMILMLVLPVRSMNAAEKTAAKDWRSGFVEVANKVKPSVVAIRSERMVTAGPGFGEDFFKGSPFEDFFKQHGGPPVKRKQMGEGSGVIVDGKGYILTNDHVVAGAEKITIHLFDGRELKGTVRGTDPRTDLAVVHVEAADLPVAVLGDSDKIQVGEWAIAVGSPFGLEETVTVGVISAKGRSGLGTGTYEDFLQTDASINPGNSGGPLVNIDGDVIGINAMIIQPGQGIGFAIPINLAKTIMQELIKTGKVVRPWVGIGLQDITPDLMKFFNLKEKEGALISQVYSGSPAERVGLKVGDVVIEVDGVKIKSSQDVVHEVLKKKVGQKVNLVILRGGKRLEISVTTAQMPEKIGERGPAKPTREWFGLQVSNVTPEIAKQLGLTKTEGVVITGVEPNSAGQAAGLKAGDIILEVNRQKILNENEYLSAMEKAKPDQGVLFLIDRQDSTFFVTLTEEK
ncbi:MAG TPA: Do family serine endopeptidase [Thermodesulfobacteriota bacterium]|nr:Do family serine endopeptidase [Thermodesulfobacteriota bacterium]